MTEELKKYEATIKKKHSFSWTPKFEEEFRTDLNKKVFVPIVVKTFERLEWDLVFQDEISAEAKYRGAWDNWTEKIFVNYDCGKVKVKSISLLSEIWDNGNNSKRVKLFIYAFQQVEKEFDKEALVKLEKDVEKANNWDDYEIPESLPPPQKRKKPQLWIPIVGGIILAFLLGFTVAFLSLKKGYMIGLFEVGVALIIGFVLKYLIKISNYTNYENLNYLLILMVGIVYMSNQYFLYQIILNKNNLQGTGFLEFLQIRLERGLKIESFNTGSIGLVISWIFQIGFTYLIATFRLMSSIASYQLERVPIEVINFTIHHFVKKKTEYQVRAELSKMGWTENQDQDEVFESLGAIKELTDLNRIG